MLEGRWIRTALAAGALAALLSGCRESEQNRPLDFQPHVYRGEKLPSLTDQQKKELEERGKLQKG